MPNFKVFQDDANALRTKLFGNDGGTTREITVNSSGQLVAEVNSGSVSATVTGTVGVSGDVSVTGTVGIADTVAVTGTVGIADTVAVTGTVGIADTVAVTGTVGIANTVAVTGTVDVANTVTITGTVEAFMERQFTEASATIQSDTGTVTYALQQDTSQEQDYTWAFLNSGTEAMVVRLQVSPTGGADDWINDGSSVTITGGTNTALVNGIYAKYTRVAYQAASSGTAATVVVYYNART